ncbi:uncharacterized protein KIAA1522 [Alosa alosa]|nr:uncharacterized protein KIAA1522 [Alosa alosa]
MSGHEREHEIDQVGNLVPRDVVEVLARERHSSRGKRRRRHGGSIRRAFSWLRRGKKAKNAQGTSRHSQDLLSTGTPVLVPKPSPKAASKEEDVRVLVPQIFQENVFLEGSRHKYVEDVHSEAQQGLKLKQLEDNNIETDYQDDQSVISGVTSRNEMGSCSERRRSIGSESTATDCMSTVSTQSISSRSTRSALSRQGSTFTPLNQGKKERTRGRRKHRRSTVVGIPRHVQKELGLDRAAWTAYQRSQEPVPSNDITGIAAVIPSAASAVDGTVSTSSAQQKAPCQPEARPKDDLALIQSVLPQSYLAERPKSVAVPWMTTAETGGVPQHPPSPVMYISPQATYLSKIIPNAVLPPSVDVVEINRNRSCNSVRTVSKCSLASASPAPSRSSSRASSSRASSRRPTLSSVSSGWSRSDSSETLVSNSSTISSSSTARASSSGQDSVVEARQVKVNPRPNGQVKVMESRDQTTGQFMRSLSVMKRAKKPPPPSRSYSLHKDKMKRRSRDLAEVDISGVKPKGGREKASGGSAGYSADESAQEESFSSGAPSPQTQQQATREGANVVHSSPLHPLTIENGLKRNLSPSSGYSSHNGTPHTTGASLPYAAKSELAAVSSNHTKPAVLALKSLFEIPQPPKVTAPPPPPPETWAHNQRTFVLLCGPGPANIKFATPPNRLQTQHGEGEVPSAETPSSLSVTQQKHTTTVMAEQDSPSMNKKPSPLPHNLNLMQELQKVQQSPLMNRAQAKQVNAPTGPPLSPLLPPPPPPLEIPLDCSLTTLDEVDLPPPPPLFSPVLPNASAKTYQGIPAGIPPPPQQPPPPPPQHPPPPPPVVAPTPKKAGSPASQAPAQPNVPKAPPLPVNFKTQASLRKVPPPQKKDPPATSDDSSSPVVTPSILQKVRLRSIKSTPKPEQNAKMPESTVEQTDQKPAVSQVPPPKPIRRSLLLAEPPPDVAALIADEPKSLPDTTEQMSKTEATPKSAQSETTVLNSQSEQPSVTSQVDSTISVSQPEATDLKSLPEPIASTPQAETSELPSQPEPPIPDSKPEQSNTPLEQSISISDSQPAIKSKTEPSVLKSEEKQSESKPELVSAVVISEPEQTEISKTPEPEHETSDVAPELVAPNSNPEAEAPVAQTEQTFSPPETDSVVPKSEPEQTSEISQSLPDVPPPISEPDTTKPDPESSLSVAQAEDTMSKTDVEPAVLTDAPASDAAESKAEAPPVTSTSEPEPAVPKSEVLSATTESNPGPDPTVSKSESKSVSTASVSQSTVTATTTTTTASTNKSQPTITISTSQAASTAPKTETHTPPFSTSSTSKSSPMSMNPSMRLQEAIRQRAAARSANDGPAKRLSVHSPPATAGGSPLKSPTSTASFIFSKSPKKVVIDTPTSPEVQSSLRKTLQTELTAVSSQSNQGDGQKKVPPPVASKPRGKSQSPRNGLPNPSSEEAVTSDVQTAGQGAQSEDTRNAA